MGIISREFYFAFIIVFDLGTKRMMYYLYRNITIIYVCLYISECFVALPPEAFIQRDQFTKLNNGTCREYFTPLVKLIICAVAQYALIRMTEF